jgi:pimeloyl-ACP methyl ester carboxylesterase
MQVARGLIAAAMLTTAGGMTGASFAGTPSTKQEPAITAGVAEKPNLPSVRGLIGKLSCTVDVFEVSGCPAFLIRPKDVPTDSSTPWVWYAPIIKNPSANPAWMLQQWLAKGIGMAGIDVGESMGNPRGCQFFSAFWERLTTRYNMSPKACLLAQSRGGLMLYNWAVENPSRVACIAGIYAACDLRSYPRLKRAAEAYEMSETELEAQLPQHNPIDRLAPLAAAHVPILHIHGDVDKLVPLDKNSAELERRYRVLGGSMKLIVVPGKGHQVCDEFFHCQEMVDFVVAHAFTK